MKFPFRFITWYFWLTMLLWPIGAFTAPFFLAGGWQKQFCCLTR